MPFHRERYPADWKTISLAVRERAGNRCEWCGARNHAVGWRDADGEFHEVSAEEAEGLAADRIRTIRIILTVAHLDHDTHNNASANHAALCQQCHLRHDARLHAQHAAQTRRGKRMAAGQRKMWEN